MTFCRPFCIGDLLASKKGCRPIGGQNDLGDLLVSFWHPFGGQKKLHDLLPSFFEFWTPKSHQKDGKKSHILFCPPIWSATKKKDSKKSQRAFWTAKGHHGEKDGNKSWHLHSPLVNEILSNGICEFCLDSLLFQHFTRK